jgi:hypothetical protein
MDTQTPNPTPPDEYSDFFPVPDTIYAESEIAELRQPQEMLSGIVQVEVDHGNIVLRRW